jgi:N-acetyltransferase
MTVLESNASSDSRAVEFDTLPPTTTMSTKVKRTYGSRVRPPLPSSPPSSLSSSSPPQPINRKRPFEEAFNTTNLPPPIKRSKSNTKSQSKLKSTQKSLTQLHFALDTSVLRTCPLCDLSYTKGAPADEHLHKSHCTRVLKGMEWGREEEREKVKAGVEEVGSGIRLKDGRRGRIVCFRADVGGRIGSKVYIFFFPCGCVLMKSRRT